MPNKNNKRNIILITIDCLRKDYFDKYKNDFEYLKDFTYLDTCISSGSNTPSSFKITMTGSYDSIENTEYSLEKEKIVLAEEMQKRNYYNIAVVAANPHISSFTYYDRGFDEFEDFLNVIESKYRSQKITKLAILKKKLTRFPLFLKHLIKIKRLIFGQLDFRKLDNIKIQENSLDISAEKVNSKVRMLVPVKTEKPLFLWIHYMDVHFPYRLPQEKVTQAKWNKLKIFYRDYSRFKDIRLSRKDLQNNKLLKFFIKSYEASVNYVFEKLNENLAYLKKQGIWNENSLVIITSDHGETFGEYGNVGHAFGIEKELYRIPFCISNNVSLEINKKKTFPEKSLFKIILKYAENIRINNEDVYFDKSYCYSVVDENGRMFHFEKDPNSGIRYLLSKEITKDGDKYLQL